ncbi:MAG: TIGR03862 family flavoprotein [Alphaproteobacteria bacterium]|nr:TIGR03862 family flavoprotein [Alphaproteobacteria bacterium]MDE2113124.1 TIGR03862 family flavoprotein [Alphaproteobacteria bacterium]MDE2492273.1 TIGR03862 family flavoprotein [Alphaproteobacteria bacterium]
MGQLSACIAVIGAGPAGLIAADVLGAGGRSVTVYDRMPSPGRKLLMAGRGGLNLTHSEDFDTFLTRYGSAAPGLAPVLRAFPPKALVAWAEALGQETFIGSSGRVFPKAMKASPLLRALLARLSAQGVAFGMRHDWRGWTDDGALRFRVGGEDISVRAGAVILALGGASWPRFGGDGSWTDILTSRGIAVTPLKPANCGFLVAWSAPFRTAFAGQPLKGAAFSFAGRSVRGEAVVTTYGIEGGAVYALSAVLRDAIAAGGSAVLDIDLRPDLTPAQIAAKLDRPTHGQSVSNTLRKALRLAPVAVNLLREAHGVRLPSEPEALARCVKSVPLTLTATVPIERAISAAGGIALSELDDHLMLRALPGVYAAGEMLDWEAPTGGYLLTACFATGVAAAKGVLQSLARST